MPHDPDRPERHEPPRLATWGPVAVIAVFAMAASACSTSGQATTAAAAGTVKPEPLPIVAASAAAPTTTAGPAFRSAPCPVRIEWIECGEVDSGSANTTFVAVVHALPADRSGRDAAVAQLDVAIDEQRAIAASVAPRGGDPLAALGPAMTMFRIEQERSAVLAAE